MTSLDNTQRLAFIVEWYDNPANLIRKYIFNYYETDNTIEMIDLKNKRMFLKRSIYDGLDHNELFLGNILTIYGRQLKFIEYADVQTKKLAFNKQKTFAMIKPEVYNQIGEIISMIENNGFLISNIKMVKLSPYDAQNFYQEHRGKPFYQKLIDYICSDYVVGMELVAENCIEKWRKFIGPTNSERAQSEAPGTIRAKFGTDGTRNAVHGSDSHKSALRELDFFFSKNSSLKSLPKMDNCSCCIIKPHIVASKKVGDVIDSILKQGFEISALQNCYIDQPIAREFLNVYRNVLPEYSAIVDHFSSGPSIVLQIRQDNCVEKFRAHSGPHDPQLAKCLRPQTIRAQFGEDRVKNAIHCTDLSEDGVLECNFFFNVVMKC